MHVYMYVYIYICMYVCVYMYVQIVVVTSSMMTNVCWYRKVTKQEHMIAIAIASARRRQSASFSITCSPMVL